MRYFKNLLQRFQKSKPYDKQKQRGQLYIGDKPVRVRKITIKQWKELFGTIEALPALIIDVIMAPEAERVAYFVVALERSFDEIVSIVSVLTDLDADYIENNASLDEIIEYFTQVAKVNDFDSIVKNIKGVLALAIPKGQAKDANPNQ